MPNEFASLVHNNPGSVVLNGNNRGSQTLILKLAVFDRFLAKPSRGSVRIEFGVVFSS